MYLKQIKILNIQSHIDTIIDLPEKGAVYFVGRNSAGKSASFKVLGKAMRGDLIHRDQREPLVRRGEKFGELLFTRSDDAQLLIHVDVESSKTFVQYTEPSKNISVRRHITTDRNTEELIELFGFHIDRESEISLNLYETYDPPLFIKTKGRVNGALVNSVITEYDAECSLKNMKESMVNLRKQKTNIENKLVQLEAIQGSLHIVDEERYEKKAKDLREYSRLLTLLDIDNIEKVNLVPNLDAYLALSKLDNVEPITLVINLPGIELLHIEPIEKVHLVPNTKDLKILGNIYGLEKVKLVNLNIRSVLDLYEVENIQDFRSAFEVYYEAIKSYKDRVCPTCGRGFVDA